jgi:hypothetical protein
MTHKERAPRSLTVNRIPWMRKPRRQTYSMKDTKRA